MLIPSFLQKKVKSNREVTRVFKYSFGKCNLNFSLRLDTKEELKDFLEILKVATNEVNEELNK